MARAKLTEKVRVRQQRERERAEQLAVAREADLEAGEQKQAHRWLLRAQALLDAHQRQREKQDQQETKDKGKREGKSGA